jgi:alkyl hydroperoxide reductase subunit AhpC
MNKVNLQQRSNDRFPWIIPDRQTGKVRHELINDLPLGRNVDEALVW